MPEKRLERAGLADADQFQWVESGWCSSCGYYSSRAGHVCPDGTRPIAISMGPTADDMRALLDDGRGRMT